jgi:uncharacterized protein YcfL
MKTRLLLPCLLSLAVLAGCTSGTVGSAEPTDTGYEANINYNSLVLATRVKVSNIITRKQNDLLQVSVDLHNHWDLSLDFQYKFKFYDKDGFEVSTDGRPWTPIVLTGNETASVQALAPNPSAVTFKIYVQD